MNTQEKLKSINEKYFEKSLQKSKKGCFFVSDNN